MNKYLSKLPDTHRKHLLNTCKKNKSFDKFLNLSRKNNLDLFDESYGKFNVKTKETIELNINKVKEKCIKAYGVDVVKNVVCDEKVIDNLKEKLYKLEHRIGELDQLAFLLNFFYENNLLYKYLSYTDRKKMVSKIIYTENESLQYGGGDYSTINFGEVSSLDKNIMELFVSSDLSDSIYESDKSKVDLTLKIDTDDEFIAEYSNK